MASLVIKMPDQQLSFMKQMLSHFQFLTIEEEPQTATVQEPQQIDVPQWQQDEVEEIMQKVKSGEMKTYTLDEVKANMQRYKQSRQI